MRLRSAAAAVLAAGAVLACRHVYGVPGTAPEVSSPFFTTKPGASGIGLVLCRQVAENHGGTILLNNRADRPGCRAVLRLPARVARQ